MPLSKYIQFIASGLSCMATATFFVLTIHIFLADVLGFDSIFNPLVALAFGGAAAAVIQLSIVENMMIASERNCPPLERKVSIVKTVLFWIVGLIFGYSMWFAAISFQNYSNEKQTHNYQYVDAQLQSNIVTLNALIGTFGQLSQHSLSLARDEKTKGNTCANRHSQSGAGGISKSHQLDSTNFQSQAQALTPITAQLEHIYSSLENKSISPRIAATKTNAVLSSPAIIATTQLVNDRLNNSHCQDAFMAAQLKSIQSYSILPLQTNHLTIPSLSKDTMEAPVALLLCFFTFDCQKLTDYKVHIWLPPLVLTLIIDLSILGSSWVQARQKPLIQWQEFYPQGKAAMLQLLLPFYIRGERHSIIVPNRPSTAQYEDICGLMYKLEAHELVFRNSKSISGLKKSDMTKLKGCSAFVRFDIDPNFLRELNKNNQVTGDTTKPVKNIMSLLKGVFSGSKHL
jgi:hypothetical protein